MPKRRGSLLGSCLFVLVASMCAPPGVMSSRRLEQLTTTASEMAVIFESSDEQLSDWDLELWPGRLVATPLNSSAASTAEASETGIISAGAENNPRARLLSESSSLPGLTTVGKAIKTVVFASMLDGTCKSDDWRGDLPRHFMRYLPGAEGFLVYARHPDRHDCSACGGHGTKGHADCDNYLAGSHRKADLLIVIGTGLSAACNKREERKGRSKCDRDSPHHYTSLDHVFHSRYAAKDTLSVHIPVRKLAPLNANSVFSFQHVIHDDEFLKPLAQEAINEMRRYCAKTPKVKKLMYVGRYTEGKGQLSFLETVDPAAVAGYVVEFFGGDYHDNELPALLRKVARQRNISATVHEQVSHQKLLHAYCQSAGLVHYAKGDNNPRVAYEALYAGMPLFVTINANLPERIYHQGFVQSLEWGAQDFHLKFGAFMSMIESSQVHKEVHAWVDRNLVPDKVYRRLCSQVGVCKGTIKVEKHPRKASSGFKTGNSMDTKKNRPRQILPTHPGEAVVQRKKTNNTEASVSARDVDSDGAHVAAAVEGRSHSSLSKVKDGLLHLDVHGIIKEASRNPLNNDSKRVISAEQATVSAILTLTSRDSPSSAAFAEAP